MVKRVRDITSHRLYKHVKVYKVFSQVTLNHMIPLMYQKVKDSSSSSYSTVFTNK